MVLLLVIVIAGITVITHRVRMQEPTYTEWVEVTDLVSRETNVYPLHEGQDRLIEFQGPEGLSFVHLRDGSAAIVKSACPDQICVEFFGWIDRIGQGSICLPNRVMIEIVEQPAQ